MRIRTIIVDDEELARKRLRRLLKKHDATVEIVGEASNGDEALETIASSHPDIIFLDVQMPGLNGFEVVRRLTDKPYIVFATAYDRYALQAFEENSVDYLLKPIEQARLDRTMDKIHRLFEHLSHPINENIERVLAQLSRESLKRLKVQVGEKIYLIDCADIAYFESKEKYTFLHTADKEYLIDTTLNDLESKLDPSNFIRIHRSHIVNVSFIRELVKWFAGRYKVRLKDKNVTELTVSRGYTDQIRRL